MPFFPLYFVLLLAFYLNRMSSCNGVYIEFVTKTKITYPFRMKNVQLKWKQMKENEQSKLQQQQQQKPAQTKLSSHNII